MAISIRGICKLNVSLATNLFRTTNFVNVGVRFIYSERMTGVTAYEKTRLLFHQQFITIEDSFRNKMVEVCGDSNEQVFTEDLKAMLHLAQKNDDDIKLVLSMMKKYIDANKDVQIGAYTFGPVVMRFFHFLDQPEVALSAYKNPEFGEFFKQRTTIQILFSLLYKHDMYNEMKDIYSMLQGSDIDTFCTSCLAAMIAVCYKENTPESYEFARQCVRARQGKDKFITDRVCTLMAALALKQGQAAAALETLYNVQRPNYVTARSLKVMALTDLRKYIHIIPIFRHIVGLANRNMNRHTFYADTIYNLEEKLNNEDTHELSELVGLIQTIKEGYLTTGKTLEEDLLRPIDTTLVKRQQQQQQQLQQLQQQQLEQQQQQQQYGRRNFSNDRSKWEFRNRVVY